MPLERAQHRCLPDYFFALSLNSRTLIRSQVSRVRIQAVGQTGERAGSKALSMLGRPHNRFECAEARSQRF